MLAPGSIQITLCLLVTYHSTEVVAASMCPAGYFCDGNSQGPCPAGHYCPEGSTNPLPCPHGTYRQEVKGQSMIDCNICPPGMYCDATGLAAPTGACDAGYYCQEGTSSPHPDSQGPCPAGHYCPTGSTNPSPCPLGTYRQEVKGQSMTDCTMCLPGMYCAGEGLAAPTGDCDAGYYCYSGSSSPQPDGSDVTGGLCPAGYYCPMGSATPIACTVGTYASLTGQSSCLVCPAGHFCPLQGATVPMQCPAGYYSDITGQTTCILCPVGHYCLAGSTSPTQCPSTFSCALTGLVSPKR
ncbi:hypothetical protein ACF0H5_023398 [Mactra antiquata]